MRFRVTLLELPALRWFIDFSKKCAPLAEFIGSGVLPA
jgi:hypothetical protein